MKNKGVVYLVQGAAIGAIYAALTLILAPISFGPWQLRVSEALCILPLYTPAAIPGLFIGCLIANIFGGFGILDIVLGSLATLLAAIAARAMNRRFLAPLPAVVFNAFLVGLILFISQGTGEATGYWFFVGLIAIEQALACYGLGIPLTFALDHFGKGALNLERKRVKRKK